MNHDSIPAASQLPVVFEGRNLSPNVYWLELLGYICDGVGDDVKEFLLNLHYAGGREHEMGSAQVLEHCVFLNELLEANRLRIMVGLSERVPWLSSEVVLSDWFAALGIMVHCAERTSVCRWSRQDTVPSDYRKKVVRVVDKLIRRAKQEKSDP